jgi:hypothetical protein
MAKDSDRCRAKDAVKAQLRHQPDSPHGSSRPADHVRLLRGRQQLPGNDGPDRRFLDHACSADDILVTPELREQFVASILRKQTASLRNSFFGASSICGRSPVCHGLGLSSPHRHRVIMKAPIDINDAFRVLTGNTPFPWQKVLFERIIAADFPESCNLPTGLGKTAVIPIWIIALANAPAIVPRRLVYVECRL